jgi:hypothetical protein
MDEPFDSKSQYLADFEFENDNVRASLLAKRNLNTMDGLCTLCIPSLRDYLGRH